MSIDWDIPEKSKGFGRIVDELIGPGATRAEIALVLLVGLIGGISMILYQYLAGLGWNLLQIAVAAFLAFDISGGVIANSTSTAKRWYHREGHDAKQHMGFVFAHIIYPLAVTALWLSFDWIYFLIVFGLLLVASGVVVAVPLYLKRPVAVLMVCVSLLVSTYILTPIPGLEWFMPFLFLKLVMGHIVREEPYRE
jgi:hypothetical protein